MYNRDGLSPTKADHVEAYMKIQYGSYHVGFTTPSHQISSPDVNILNKSTFLTTM